MATRSLNARLGLSVGNPSAAIEVIDATAKVAAHNLAVSGTTVPQTGIYASGANTLNFSANGANQMTLDSTGDLTIPHTNTNTNAAMPNVYIDGTGKLAKSTATPAGISDVLAYAVALG